MKILQPTLLLLLFVPLIKPAPPTQQNTDNFEEILFTRDYEDQYLDGKNIKVPHFHSKFTSKIV